MLLRALPFRLRGLLTACVLLVASGGASAETFVVRIDAGADARRATPVSVVLGHDAPEGAGAFVYGAHGIDYGQVERLDGGKCRVTWLIRELAAGESMTVRVAIAEGIAAPAMFHWAEPRSEGGTSVDLLLGESPALRYEYTPFDPEHIEETKKVFHQVFSPDGQSLVTKGAGGLYPHHRGIYFGYSKCTVPGVEGTLDTWHAAKGEHQKHAGFLATPTGPVFGGHTLAIDWNDRAGQPFAREERRLTVYAQPGGAKLIEFASKLVPTRGPVRLDGDPQHAGVQFRPSQWVAEHQKETRYLRPEKWKDLPEDQEVNYPGNKEHIDLPWNAVRFAIDGQPYTVAYLSHPDNPDGAQASERLYGRFGEFFPYDLLEDRPLVVTYRWWIVPSHEVTRETIEAKYREMAAPPVVTVVD